MKKLLIFHPAIAPYRIDFFNDLHKHFQTKMYLFYDNLIDQKFNTEWISSRYTFKPLYLKSGFRIMGKTFKIGITRSIRSFQPDIILIPEFGYTSIIATIYKSICAKKCKLIVLCDDSIDIAIDYGKIRKTSRHFILKHTDGIILCNPKTQSWYNTHFHIPSFNFPILQEDNGYRDRLQKAIPISNQYIEKYQLLGKKLVLFVGRLASVKNLPFLIDSFEIAKKIDSQIKLVLVGSGEQEEYLKKIVTEHKLNNDVLFPGRYENTELAAWYNIASLFVLPSTYEPFGTVANEALLAGVPTLISEKSGSAFLVEKDDNIFPLQKEALSKLIQLRLSEQQPIAHINSIKPSLMTIFYEDYMTQLVNWIYNIC